MCPQTASAAAAVRAPELVTLCRPDELADRMQVYDRIARRAYDIFEARGRVPGHDRQDWLQAEAEFLRPVPVEVQQFADKIVVRAGVLGFEASELQTAIEPRRITIAGKKEQAPEKGNKVFYIDWYPDELLRVVELPAEIIPEFATAELHGGVLEFELPRELGWESPEIEC